MVKEKVLQLITLFSQIKTLLMKKYSILITILILVTISFITIQGRNKVQKATISSYNNQLQVVAFKAAVERQLLNIENSIINAAEDMPENQFNFTPEDLHIQGSNFKGVRTFAGQVKHLATDNYHIWSAITGDPLPPGVVDVNGPVTLTSKQDILKYLRESFALGHKVIAGLNSDNAMDLLDFRGGKLHRLDLVFYALTHDEDHYGQMAVYMRMIGVEPPGNAVRQK
jgi:Uncharacterized protein conserved in bacteria